MYKRQEKNWYKANPSLGYTISIDRVRDAYREALDNPAEENVFKQLRLNIWTNSAVAWIPEHIYDRGNQKIDYTSLLGRDCYAGLDLSSTSDITALVLVFHPRTDGEKYIVLPFFGCRRKHWNFAAAGIMFFTMCGSGKGIFSPRKET